MWRDEYAVFIFLFIIVSVGSAIEQGFIAVIDRKKRPTLSPSTPPEFGEPPKSVAMDRYDAHFIEHWCRTNGEFHGKHLDLAKRITNTVFKEELRRCVRRRSSYVFSFNLRDFTTTITDITLIMPFIHFYSHMFNTKNAGFAEMTVSAQSPKVVHITVRALKKREKKPQKEKKPKRARKFDPDENWNIVFPSFKK